MPTAKIGKNIFANYFGMFIHILIGFILSPYLVNTLGDTNYGIWSIAAALTGYMSLFDLGLNSAVNKYVAWYSGQKNQVMVNKVLSSAALLFGIASSLVLILAPFLASGITESLSFENTDTPLIHTLVLVVCFDVSLFVFGGLFRGSMGGIQRYDVINIIQIVAAIYKALAFYAVLELGYGIVELAITSASANFMSGIAFAIAFKRLAINSEFSHKNISKETSIDLVNFSKFTFLAMLANQIVYYSDAFVIGYFMSAAAVTYYSIAWTLTEYSKKLCLAFSRTFAPAVSELDSQGANDSIRSIYLSGSKYLMIISNLFCIGFIVLGGDFVAIWMGEKYKELCEPILVILFINQLILSPQHISYALLQGVEKQKSYTYYTVLVSFASLALSISLVQKYGLIGVAIGTVLPQIIFHGFIVPRLTLKAIGLTARVYIGSTYLKTLIPSAILTLSLAYCAEKFKIDGYITLLASAFTGTLIYLIASYIFTLDKGEKYQATALLRKLYHR